MKEKTLLSVVMGSYTALALSWASLNIHQIISNRIEDRDAVTKVEVSEGSFICSIYRYVAFSKTQNGEIDEIKEYGRTMIGCRSLASLPFVNRYHKGNPKFETLRGKYFTQEGLEHKIK